MCENLTDRAVHCTATCIGDPVVRYAKRSTIDEWCRVGEQTDYVVDSCYVKGFLSSHYWQYVRDRRGQESFRFRRTAHEDIAGSST